MRKKVCLVVSSILLIRCFLRPHLCALAERFEVCVILNGSDVLPEDIEGLPVRLIYVDIERQIDFGRDISALFALIRIFRRERFDLVHSISPKAGLLAMLASSATWVPLRLHTFQGEVWVTRRGLWRFILKMLDKLVARLATHLLVVSPSEQKFLIEQGIVFAGKSAVLVHGSISGVDTNRFHPRPSVRSQQREEWGLGETDLLFLFVGRLNVDKGVLDLATAFGQLACQHGHIHLAFVGPDEEGMRPKIEALCGAPDVRERLHFSGFTPKPELVMPAADVVCLPSYREGFGMVIIESAAIGLPAIASRIYGITDALLEEKTGLLFESGNVDELKEKMEHLVADPALRARLGQCAKARVESDFSQPRIVAATVDYYAALLTEGDATS